jgi:hypothetical protein
LRGAGTDLPRLVLDHAGLWIEALRRRDLRNRRVTGRDG